jgi:hypothetical protein
MSQRNSSSSTRTGTLGLLVRVPICVAMFLVVTSAVVTVEPRTSKAENLTLKCLSIRYTTKRPYNDYKSFLSNVEYDSSLQ